MCRTHKIAAADQRRFTQRVLGHHEFVPRSGQGFAPAATPRRGRHVRNRGRYWIRDVPDSHRLLAGRTICPSAARAWRAALELLVCGRSQVKLNSPQTLRLSSARESCGSADNNPLTRCSASGMLKRCLTRFCASLSEYTNHLSSSSTLFMITGQALPVEVEVTWGMPLPAASLTQETEKRSPSSSRSAPTSGAVAGHGTVRHARAHRSRRWSLRRYRGCLRTRLTA